MEFHSTMDLDGNRKHHCEMKLYNSMAIWMCSILYNSQLDLIAIDRDQYVYLKHIFRHNSYRASQGICATFCEFIMNELAI